jgi:hypothetical protein
MRIRKSTLQAFLVGLIAVLAAPAAAHAAPCPPGGPDRPGYTVYVKDANDLRDDATPIEERNKPLPLLHTFEVSMSFQQIGATTAGDVDIEAPAGVPSRHDGQTLEFAPQAAGQIVLTATWTETGVNPTCTGSATIPLQIAALSERPRVKFLRFSASDRPLIELTMRVARGALGDARPLVIRAKVGRRASAPSGTPGTLFTLPFGLPSFGTKPPRSGRLALRTAKRSGIAIRAQSVFDEQNFDQVPVPTGGTGAQVTLSFDGTGRKVRNQFGSFYRRGVLSRRGLVLEAVQGGKVLARLRTGILCVNPGNSVPRCRFPGYKATT